MLKSVRIQNYRNIKDETLELGPLQVLVGKNGVGKSNIVDVFRFISDALLLSPVSAVEARGALTSLCRWSSPDQPSESFAFTVTGGTNTQGWAYHVELGKASGECSVLREWLMLGPASHMRTEFDVARGKWRIPPGHVNVPLNTRILYLAIFGSDSRYREVYQPLTRAMCWAIYPHVLRKPQKPMYGEPLRDNGENLFSVLHAMQTANSPGCISLKQELSRIAANVRDVKVVEREGWLFLQFLHPDPEPHWLDASEQSDGTLRALAILTALHQPQAPSLIAIEEPELNLHPGAMGVLCDAFLEASERMQVLLTTHSPDLIARFPVECLRVLELQDGLARVGPVDEAQRQSIEEELFSAGDILRIDGALRMAPS